MIVKANSYSRSMAMIFQSFTKKQADIEFSGSLPPKNEVEFIRQLSQLL